PVAAGATQAGPRWPPAAAPLAPPVPAEPPPAPPGPPVRDARAPARGGRPARPGRAAPGGVTLPGGGVALAGGGGAAGSRRARRGWPAAAPGCVRPRRVVPGAALLVRAAPARGAPGLVTTAPGQPGQAR